MQCFVSSPCLHFSASSGHQQDLDYQSHWHLWMPAEPTSQNNFKFISLGPLKLPIVLDSSKELLCRSQRNELKTQAQLKETEHDLAVRKRVLFFLRIYALKTPSKQSSGMQCTVHTPALLSNLFLTAIYMRRSTRMSSPDWIPFPETHKSTQDLVDFAKAFRFKENLILVYY